MDLTTDQRDGINIALNEASWLEIKVDTETARAEVTFDVLTLPAAGPAPDDAVVVLVLSGISRVVASLRGGRWDDAGAPVQQLSLAGLDSTVRSFGGSPVYGWEFIDPPAESWASWRDRLSLDISLLTAPARHVLELFQEGDDSTSERHLDLRIWFDRVPSGTTRSPLQAEHARRTPLLVGGGGSKATSG